MKKLEFMMVWANELPEQVLPDLGGRVLEEVAALAQARGVPYLPGVLTPTEVERALALGLSALKFFPAEPFQGARVLKAYAEVFPEVRFLPTGGISPWGRTPTGPASATT